MAYWGLVPLVLLSRQWRYPPTCYNAVGESPWSYLYRWLASSRHEIIVSFLNLFLLFTPKTGTLNFNSFPSFQYSSTQQTHTVAAEVCCLLYGFVLASSVMILISWSHVQEVSSHTAPGLVCLTDGRQQEMTCHFWYYNRHCGFHLCLLILSLSISLSSHPKPPSR